MEDHHDQPEVINDHGHFDSTRLGSDVYNFTSLPLYSKASLSPPPTKERGDVGGMGLAPVFVNRVAIVWPQSSKLLLVTRQPTKIRYSRPSLSL